MKVKLLLTALVFVGGFLLISGGLMELPGDKTQGKSLDIPGKWTFSASPDLDEGFNSRPVIVWSTKTVKKTLTIEGVLIENLSSKKVSAVKIGWKLIDRAESSVVQRIGNTKFLRLSDDLGHGSSKYLEGDFFSFYDAYKPLLKKGSLNGDYLVKIFVSEVEFADKSIWKSEKEDKIELLPDGINDSILGTISETLYVKPAVVSSVCPRQECKYESGPPAMYTCQGTISDQYCTNCVTSCCNSICGSPPSQCQSCN